ncbi:MAG TPA: GNAT family acetyltransferase [Bacillota bacterium]|nr:GNAT family acetyltransferase [Bacillota bacterium]HQJ37985.1 GNAT family acetyltransferase [Bacillota bacterium]
MIYRNAVIKDIPAISELQKKYHIATISEEDKPDGFVTTLFTEEQFKELIEKEDGIAIACDGDKIAAYAMAASWEYWSKWPIFQYMIEDLQNIEYMGQILSVKNSYQYGPICIDKDYRGTEVLPMIFDFSRMQMKNKYPILITFINHINSRSYNAHTKKLGLDVIKSFVFNNNNYYELGYDTSKKVRTIQENGGNRFE